MLKEMQSRVAGKKATFLVAALLGLFATTSSAQSNIPQGFEKGQVVLANGTSINGWIKDEMNGKAAVTVLPEAGGKKQRYDAYNLSSVTIGAQQFRCISGDFFKVICSGDIDFLQKTSNCAGKMVYNGSEAVYLNGTDGKPGNYFMYTAKTAALQLVTDKNLATVAQTHFSDCAAAINKAKETGNDVAKLKDAVDIYNSRNNK
jgi:hypothetical protein